MTRVLGLLLALTVAAQQAPPAGPPGGQQVQERVTVERIILRGRVVDRSAKLVPGLGIPDFRVRVDGQETPVEAVDWIPAQPTDEHGPAAPAEKRPEIVVTEAAPTTSADEPPEPQLFVLLFQWEIAGQKDVGFLRMVRQALQFVDAAAPQDRIAVLGFGSGLHVLQDFTRDHAAVKRAILDVRSSSHAASGDGGPSMAEYTTVCGRADSIEQALICIGNGLRPIPGEKTMLFFGWTLQSHRSSLIQKYPPIVQAIEAAHTTVFALDVSDGSHALSAGLKRLAVDTGGMYQETFDFPALSRQRVQATVTGGHYDLVFRNPSAERGWHNVEVEVTAPRTTAQFPRWFRN